MGNSLQDQLQRSGLVDGKQAKQAKQARRKRRKQGAGDPAEQARAAVRRAEAEKAEGDRQLNLARVAQAEERAAAAQVRQLVESGRVQGAGGDLAYNFVDGDVVRRLHLGAAAHAGLGAGSLAIVRLDGVHEVVPAAVAAKVAERDPGAVVVANDRESAPSGEEGYEGYEVPDDLIW